MKNLVFVLFLLVFINCNFFHRNSTDKITPIHSIGIFDDIRINNLSYDTYFDIALNFYESANKKYIYGNRDEALNDIILCINILKKIQIDKNTEFWQILNIEETLRLSIELYEKILKNIFELHYDNSKLILTKLLSNLLTDKIKISELRRWEKFAKIGVPFELKKEVEEQIHFFTVRRRKVFSKWMYRSGYFEKWISDTLFYNGLPDELVYLSMIESGFNPNAYSKARAVGLWQFIYPTAKRYNVKIDFWYDGRRDPYKSTQTAIKHLNFLYKYFGNWYLALSAYNSGIYRVKRAIKKDKTTDFWELKSLPRETRKYVPKFLAAMHIYRNMELYGYTEDSISDGFEFETFPVSKFLKLSKIARALGISESELKFLNPELIRGYTDPDIKNYPLRIPVGYKEKMQKIYPHLKPEKKKLWYKHKLAKGETIWDIARKYKVSSKLILRLNNIKNPRLLRPGRNILIPIEAS